MDLEAKRENYPSRKTRADFGFLIFSPRPPGGGEVPKIRCLESLKSRGVTQISSKSQFPSKLDYDLSVPFEPFIDSNAKTFEIGTHFPRPVLESCIQIREDDRLATHSIDNRARIIRF